MFFLNLFKQKLPQRCPKRVGGRGVKATFGQCPKVSGFFFGITSLSLLRPGTGDLLILSDTPVKIGFLGHD